MDEKKLTVKVCPAAAVSYLSLLCCFLSLDSMTDIMFLFYCYYFISFLICHWLVRLFKVILCYHGTIEGRQQTVNRPPDSISPLFDTSAQSKSDETKKKPQKPTDQKT